MIHLKRLGFGFAFAGSFAAVIASIVFLAHLFPYAVVAVLLLAVVYCIGAAFMADRERW